MHYAPVHGIVSIVFVISGLWNGFRGYFGKRNDDIYLRSGMLNGLDGQGVGIVIQNCYVDVAKIVLQDLWV